MGKLKTLDFIADHVTSSRVKEMEEQVEEMLYTEGVIEETNADAVDIIHEVMRQVAIHIHERYVDEPLNQEDIY